MQTIHTTERLYLEEEVKGRFAAVAAANYFATETPGCEVVHNGFILPAKKIMDEDNVPYFKGGVADDTGKFVKASQTLREGKGGSLAGGYAFNLETAQARDRDVLYAGVLINHFGHFLMESTNRLWYWVENRDKNLDIAFILAKKQPVIPQFWEFMELMGIPREKIHLIKEPTKFHTIYIPAVSHILNRSYNEKFLIPFRYIRENVSAEKYAKVYLSRTKFTSGTPCLGEEHIERLFRDNGYKIIFPEQLTLKQQVAYVKGAEEMAGVLGTATHMAVFAHKGVKSLILERSDSPVIEQEIVHQALQADWYNIGVNMNPFPIDHSAGPVLLGITGELCRYCKEHFLSVDVQSCGYIRTKDCRAFLREYMGIYTQEGYNQRLARQYPVIARRLLKMGGAFVPLKRKIKQKIKSFIARRKNKS